VATNSTFEEWKEQLEDEEKLSKKGKRTCCGFAGDAGFSRKEASLLRLAVQHGTIKVENSNSKVVPLLERFYHASQA